MWNMNPLYREPVRCCPSAGGTAENVRQECRSPYLLESQRFPGRAEKREASRYLRPAPSEMLKRKLGP